MHALSQLARLLAQVTSCGSSRNKSTVRKTLEDKVFPKLVKSATKADAPYSEMRSAMDVTVVCLTNPALLEVGPVQVFSRARGKLTGPPQVRISVKVILAQRKVSARSLVASG